MSLLLLKLPTAGCYSRYPPIVFVRPLSLSYKLVTPPLPPPPRMMVLRGSASWVFPSDRFSFVSTCCLFDLSLCWPDPTTGFCPTRIQLILIHFILSTLALLRWWHICRYICYRTFFSSNFVRFKDPKIVCLLLSDLFMLSPREWVRAT